MNKKQYTPGPWRMGRHGAIVSDTPVPEISGSDETDYYGGHLICESVTNWNARLIACAPDLVAALKDCIERMERCRKILQASDNPGNWGMLDTTRAQAVIDRVDGVDPLGFSSAPDGSPMQTNSEKTMNTKAAHTPTPWQLTTVPVELMNTDSAASIYGPQSIQGGACLIADISRSAGDEQAIENARIIITAVNHHQELVTRLENLVKQAKLVHDEILNQPRFPNLSTHSVKSHDIYKAIQDADETISKLKLKS